MGLRRTRAVAIFAEVVCISVVLQVRFVRKVVAATSVASFNGHSALVDGAAAAGLVDRVVDSV